MSTTTTPLETMTKRLKIRIEVDGKSDEWYADWINEAAITMGYKAANAVPAAMQTLVVLRAHLAVLQWLEQRAAENFSFSTTDGTSINKTGIAERYRRAQAAVQAEIDRIDRQQSGGFTRLQRADERRRC